MANTYSLEILRLEVKLLENTLENVVFQAHWRYTATSEDGQYIEQVVGTASIGAPDLDNFVPFEDLTESQVVSWVESAVDFEPFKQNLDAAILEKQQPTAEVKNVPW